MNKLTRQKYGPGSYRYISPGYGYANIKRTEWGSWAVTLHAPGGGLIQRDAKGGWSHFRDAVAEMRFLFQSLLWRYPS